MCVFIFILLHIFQPSCVFVCSTGILFMLCVNSSSCVSCLSLTNSFLLPLSVPCILILTFIHISQRNFSPPNLPTYSYISAFLCSATSPSKLTLTLGTFGGSWSFVLVGAVGMRGWGWTVWTGYPSRRPSPTSRWPQPASSPASPPPTLTTLSDNVPPPFLRLTLIYSRLSLVHLDVIDLPTFFTLS